MIRVRGPMGTFRTLLMPGVSALLPEDPEPLAERPGQAAGGPEPDPGQGMRHVD